MTDTNFPSTRAEIISAPAINNMTVAPVGSNMFSLNLNLVLIVRFPNASAGTEKNKLRVSTAIQSVSNSSGSSSTAMYANGDKPESDGETAAFDDFVRVHGYSPPSRDALSTWVQNQQGAPT